MTSEIPLSGFIGPCNEVEEGINNDDLLSRAFGSNVTEDILDEWIKESDINKDGKIDYSDFLQKIKQQKKEGAETIIDNKMYVFII